MRRLQLVPVLAFLLATTTARANRALVVADHKPTKREILRLIDQLTTKDADDAANKLLSFGFDGVPTLIERLDDRRPMDTDGIGYHANASPEGFEAIAHWSPKQVIDCLTTILGLVTEARVKCPLESGGSDEDRAACVQRWRAWGKAHQAASLKAR